MDIINRIKYICFTPNNIIKPLDLKREALLVKPEIERISTITTIIQLKKKDKQERKSSDCLLRELILKKLLHKC